MFPEYLKQKRLSLGMTQMDLAAKLNLFSPYFHSLDNVTISRWERGISSPSRYKTIIISRYFNDETCEFIIKQSISSDLPNIKNFIIQRYFSVTSKANKIVFNTIKNNEKKRFYLPSIPERYINDIHYFYHQLNVSDESLHLSDINVMNEHNKSSLNLFYNKESNIDGYSISFYFKDKSFFKQARNDSHIIDYATCVDYHSIDDLVFYNCSRFAIDESTYLSLFYLDILNAVKLSNIKYIAYRIINKIGYELYKSLGFSVLSSHNKSPIGEIKIGSTRYKEVILYISIEDFLSSSEIIKIFQMIHVLNEEERMNYSIIEQ